MPVPSRLGRLKTALAPDERALLAHPLYAALKDVDDVRGLMATHVFAVWDFMSLTKALQRDLTCVDVPWLPPADPEVARFVNEIVLGEESDEIAPGRHLSHLELYLRAMDEVGADSSVFRRFLARLRRGVPAGAALADRAIAPRTRAFVSGTLRVARRPTHEVAAAFLFGRESVIPEMFRRILARRGALRGPRLKSFRLYLDRHVALDGEEHGPMAARLLTSVCGADAAKWAAAEKTARAAIAARLRLWDGVLAGLRSDGNGRRLV